MNITLKFASIRFCERKKEFHKRFLRFVLHFYILVLLGNGRYLKCNLVVSTYRLVSFVFEPG